MPWIDRLRAKIGLGGLENFPCEIDRHFIVERERADRHASYAADIFDHRRGHTLCQHQVAFANISVDHA